LNLNQFARRIPKAEIHAHLEGSIHPETLLELARRNHIDLPVKGLDDLKDFYRYRDFEHFVEIYHTITRCLCTPQDYYLIAYQFGSDCARQNIRYSEVTFTITSNMRFSGLSWEIILEALNAGRSQAKAEFGVEIRWVFDILRNIPESQDLTTDIALMARNDGVVALGLGGSEALFPPELFIRSFDRAVEADLPRVPHAGELLGPSSVWTAIDKLHADRLGHGVRSIEDPKLMEVIIGRQIPLEICPTSNLCLGIYPDYATHPLRRLWDAGAYVTINSDDPPMFGCDLDSEYQVLVDHFDFTADELKQISLNALRASLLPEADKTRLEGEFKAEFASLRQELA
jgi:aminodeoxyfutalosine deaminase